MDIASVTLTIKIGDSAIGSDLTDLGVTDKISDITMISVAIEDLIISPSFTDFVIMDVVTTFTIGPIGSMKEKWDLTTIDLMVIAVSMISAVVAFGGDSQVYNASTTIPGKEIFPGFFRVGYFGKIKKLLVCQKGLSREEK